MIKMCDKPNFWQDYNKFDNFTNSINLLWGLEIIFDHFLPFSKNNSNTLITHTITIFWQDYNKFDNFTKSIKITYCGV